MFYSTKRLILLSMIVLSGVHCTSKRDGQVEGTNNLHFSLIN